VEAQRFAILQDFTHRLFPHRDIEEEDLEVGDRRGVCRTRQSERNKREEMEPPHGTNLGDREGTARSVLVTLAAALAAYPIA